MSFTITDKELEQLIQNASLAAAEQAAKNVVAELLAKQVVKPSSTVVPIVQEASEAEVQQMMKAMFATK